MDYGTVIFVNLILFGIMYSVFSIRLRRAVEKAKKQGIPREFYENVEMVVHYLDTTLESIQQKNEAFYRLVSRADELKKELEALLAQYEKTRRRKRSVPQKLQPESTEPKEDRVDPAIERLLRDAGEDRIEWSGASNPADLAELIGAKKDRAVNYSSGKTEKPNKISETWLTGLGRTARRFLGLPATLSSPATSDDFDFNDTVPEQKKQMSGAQEVTQEQKINFEPELLSYAPRTADRQKAAASAEDRPVDALSDRAEPEEVRPSWMTEMTVPDLSNAKERATFVRSLLLRDVPVDEIAAFTGITVGEIDFIKKVMEGQSARLNRRRGI